MVKQKTPSPGAPSPLDLEILLLREVTPFSSRSTLLRPEKRAPARRTPLLRSPKKNFRADADGDGRFSSISARSTARFVFAGCYRFSNEPLQILGAQPRDENGILGTGGLTDTAPFAQFGGDGNHSFSRAFPVGNHPQRLRRAGVYAKSTSIAPAPVDVHDDLLFWKFVDFDTTHEHLLERTTYTLFVSRSSRNASPKYETIST